MPCYCYALKNSEGRIPEWQFWLVLLVQLKQNDDVEPKLSFHSISDKCTILTSQNCHSGQHLNHLSKLTITFYDLKLRKHRVIFQNYYQTNKQRYSLSCLVGVCKHKLKFFEYSDTESILNIQNIILYLWDSWEFTKPTFMVSRTIRDHKKAHGHFQLSTVDMLRPN